ncbi:MAG: endospore germination permease [Desulfotomaculaceae bacterium]|nr:endospore germination permease [Desulfotomaculaceae bacterium]
MLNKNKISDGQAIVLIVLASISSALFFVPLGVVTIVDQDAWIAMILATFLAMLLVYYPLADLGRRYPGKTIIQYSENILGRFAGKLVGAIFVYYFFQNHCWALREFGEVTAVFLPKTPMLVIMLLLSLLTAYAVNSGLEVIGRCAELLFPIGVFALVFIVVGSAGLMDFTKIMPVMEGPVLPLLWATLIPLDWLSVGFVFSVITASVNKRSIVKNGLTAVGMAGVILTVFSLVNIMVIGTPLLKKISFPLLELARYGKIPVFERMEVLIVVFWSSWIFVKGALFSYATVLSLSQFFNLAGYRFLILSETVLAIAYAVYQYNSFVEMSYLFNTATLYYISLSVGLPFTLWLVSIARSKSG